MKVVPAKAAPRGPAPAKRDGRVSAGARDQERNGDAGKERTGQGERVPDESGQGERRRLEVEEKGHPGAGIGVPQRELAVVDGDPVERVPRHRLGDDVAVQAVVDGQVGDVGQKGKLVSNVRRPERKAVPQGRRQVGAQRQYDPGQAQDISPGWRGHASQTARRPCLREQ